MTHWHIDTSQVCHNHLKEATHNTINFWHIRVPVNFLTTPGIAWKPSSCWGQFVLLGLCEVFTCEESTLKCDYLWTQHLCKIYQIMLTIIVIIWCTVRRFVIMSYFLCLFSVCVLIWLIKHNRLSLENYCVCFKGKCILYCFRSKLRFSIVWTGYMMGLASHSSYLLHIYMSHNSQSLFCVPRLFWTLGVLYMCFNWH